MAARRKCSECGEPLTNPTAKTCTNACRKKRARRLARSRKAGGEKLATPEHLEPLRRVTDRQAKDVMHEVLKEEARPVAREALTEDVLRSLGDLIHLTPVAVANVQRDLESGDEKIRQRATELLLRYTLGNQSIAPTAQNAPAPMQVVLTWPTAPTEVVASSVDTTADPLELSLPDDEQPALPPAGGDRACMECHETKPATAFEGNSERCTGCHDALMAAVRERFPGEV